MSRELISIVMAYHNRRRQLLATLRSISACTFIDQVEVIIVDDASDEEHRLEGILPTRPLIKLVRIDPSQKWWANPCVPFNIGFAHVNPDASIVMLQNPECFHIGDLVGYVAHHLHRREYVSFAAYSADKDTSELAVASKVSNVLSILDTRMSAARWNGDNGWYNHSVIRPTHYHFAAAIHKAELFELLTSALI